MEEIRSELQNEIENFGSFGATLKISPKSRVTLNKAGCSMKFFVPSVEVLIGIGKDHTARLIMDTDAWEALKAGEKVDITTLKEFKEKFM